MTATGKDRIATKGVAYGVGVGSLINAIISGGPNPKIGPQTAKTNLARIVAHAAYGLTAVFSAAKLGDPSLFAEVPIVADVKRMTTSQAK